MTDTRAWVRLPSGRRLDLLNPTPFDWTDEDLAIGLARTFRWGGHSTWPQPLTPTRSYINPSVSAGWSGRPSTSPWT